MSKSYIFPHPQPPQTPPQKKKKSWKPELYQAGIHVWLLKDNSSAFLSTTSRHFFFLITIKLDPRPAQYIYIPKPFRRKPRNQNQKNPTQMAKHINLTCTSVSTVGSPQSNLLIIGKKKNPFTYYQRQTPTSKAPERNRKRIPNPIPIPNRNSPRCHL